jgi:Immunity protein 53
VSNPDVLAQLQRWYSEQCDGEWEHSFGVVIDTLDNPGWRVRVDVDGTPIKDRRHERIEAHRTDEDWLVLWRDEKQWHAACGPLNLTEVLNAFLVWSA